MVTMRVAQVSHPKGPFEIVERPIPEPGVGAVRIKVHACGICHSDSIVKEGIFPGIPYPRVPGHEVAGAIDAVGQGVAGLAPGQRVGVGWNGGYCGYCDHCRRGEFFACVTGQVTGVTYDGGYGEYMIAPASAVALLPEELPAVEAAPLMCAGLTTFNALRNSGARPGEVVAVLGLGGLGHLGVQFAAKMGFHTVGDRTRQRQGDRWPSNRRFDLHRQSGAGPRGGASQARRCQGHPGDRDQRRGDGRGPGRIGGQWHADDPRRGRVDAGVSHVPAPGFPVGQGLVFRDLDRLAGYARVSARGRACGR